MKVAILGAGMVGLHIGGYLLTKDHQVTFIGRQRLQQQLKSEGLKISNLENQEISFPPEKITYETEANVALTKEVFDYVLVTLKAINNDDAIAALKDLNPKTVVVTFQNGVNNAEKLQAAHPGLTIIPGMFPYNVVELPGSHVHQASFGRIMIQKRPEVEALVAAFRDASLLITEQEDMQAVLYGKLVFNLNNALNALSGLSIRNELSDRRYRVCLAAAISEALAVYHAANITAYPVSGSPLWLIPYVMRLPDFVFTTVASGVLAIDKEAYGSMYQDLKHRRKTEVELLNGIIVELGKKHGIPTPVNEKIVGLVNEAEAANNGSPNIGPDDLTQKLGLQSTMWF